MSSVRPITLINQFVPKEMKCKKKKKRTDIVCIELVDTNKCSNSGSSQTPFCNLTNDGEFTGR